MNTARIKGLAIAVVLASVAALNAAADRVSPTCAPTWVDGGSIASGVFHQLSPSGFRRADDAFPPKGERRRVLAIGDSYTFGQAVEVGATWPAQLESLTGDEVFNLGRCGANSSDVLDLVVSLWGASRPRRNGFGDLRRVDLHGLHPDAIVYAICLNDIMRDRPLRASLSGSRMALLRISAPLVAPTFAEQIERDGDWLGFTGDVAAMDAISRAHGIPFRVGVFDNQGLALLRGRVERTIDELHIKRIPFVLPEGDWRVSRCEAHPNAAAHRLFAEAIARSVP